MAVRAYTRDPLGLGDYTLQGPEAHHLATVRRITIADPITLFNGDGAEYHAEVIGLSKKSIQLVIHSRNELSRERTQFVWIASAIPKGDRIDFLIEKLTELGVSRFTPLLTERSVVRPQSSVVEKYQRMVIEASKQCGRNRLMQIDGPTSWSALLKSELPDHRYILHPGTASTLSPLNVPVIYAIGPEGGFTDDEVAQSNWQPLTLGPTILRIETAAIAAACLQSP